MKTLAWKTAFVVCGFFGLMNGAVHAQLAQPKACEEIRQQIGAQRGLLVKPDTVLLEKIGTHPDCAFTTAEVYRAAFGDQPMVKDERSFRRNRHGDDD